MDPDDPRRKMTARQIIECTVDLSPSCLSKEEQEDVYKMLVKYREALSLRDEIDMCPNIEVDLQFIDKSPFSSDHFMSKKRINQ